MAVAAKKRKRTKNHVSLGDYGASLLRVMYRLRGGTVDELTEHLARELTAAQTAGDYSSAEVGRDYHERREDGTLRLSVRVYRTLASLREGRLVESLALPRQRRDGARNGRPKSFYQLTSKGAAMAGSLSGIDERRQASAGYGRHGGVVKVGHARQRNLLYRLMTDAAADASGVEVDHRSLWGESHESFPIFGGRILDAAGQPVVAPGKRRYEQCEPDGLVPISFGGGLTYTYHLEVETMTRTAACQAKVDRYAAHALRAHEALAPAQLGASVSALEEEVGDLEAVDPLTLTSQDRERLYTLRAKLKAAKKRKDTAVDRFLGMPESVLPILFVLPTADRARAMAQRLREQPDAMPRYQRLQRLWNGHVDFSRFVLWAGMDDIRSGRIFSPSPWIDMSGNVSHLRVVAEKRRQNLLVYADTTGGR